jgi:hypothetical protein
MKLMISQPSCWLFETRNACYVYVDGKDQQTTFNFALEYCVRAEAEVVERYGINKICISMPLFLTRTQNEIQIKRSEKIMEGAKESLGHKTKNPSLHVPSLFCHETADRILEY